MKKNIVMGIFCSIFIFFNLGSMQDFLEQVNLEEELSFKEIYNSLDVNHAREILNVLRRSKSIKGMAFSIKKLIDLSCLDLDDLSLKFCLIALRKCNYFNNVKFINLRKNNITRVPVEIFEFPNLQGVDLRGNSNLSPRMFADQVISTDLFLYRRRCERTLLIVDNAMLAANLNKVKSLSEDRAIGGVLLGGILVSALGGIDRILETCCRNSLCRCKCCVGCCGGCCQGCSMEMGGRDKDVSQTHVNYDSDAKAIAEAVQGCVASLANANINVGVSRD